MADDDTEGVAPGLVAAIRAGSVTAFETLYKLYWTRLCQFAFRYVQSAEEAEEVVQDVFFRIWRQRIEWNVVGSPDNYLYLAVRNAALDRLERAAVAHRFRDQAGDSVRTRSEPADQAVLDAEIAAAVERAFSELPPRRRSVCMLRWVNNMSYAQIAERLGISEKGVEKQIVQGHKFLRTRLAVLRR